MVDVLMYAGFAGMVYFGVRAIRSWLAIRKSMRDRITIVRGLHQQDEDLAFPQEFVRRMAEDGIPPVQPPGCFYDINEPGFNCESDKGDRQQ